MDIEVNEYVRTIEGKIGKIIKYENFEYHIKIDKDEVWKCSEDFIVKHSKQLIDLIEVGDYVNGYRVEQASIETNEVLLDHNGFGWRTLKDGDKIVTHEQFESIEYKVEEEK